MAVERLKVLLESLRSTTSGRSCKILPRMESEKIKADLEKSQLGEYSSWPTPLVQRKASNREQKDGSHLPLHPQAGLQLQI